MNRLAELRKAACTWALYKDSSASYRLLVAIAYHRARESAMQARRKFWADFQKKISKPVDYLTFV